MTHSLCRKFFSISFVLVLLVSLEGCGYSLRGNTRKVFADRGIQTLYVRPVKNNSYKAGVEITVYNALRKRMAQGGYVRLVDSPQAADAEIAAVVIDATYAPGGITTADKLSSVGSLQQGPSNVQIASSYNVNLSIQFKLEHKDATVWSDSLQRSKSFPASTYFGVLGSTSALINESEFERTLAELAANLVTDAEESMNLFF